MINPVSQSLQINRHSPIAVKWRSCILLINQTHQFGIFKSFLSLPIIKIRPIDSQKFTLPNNRNPFVFRFDQRPPNFSWKRKIFFWANQVQLSVARFVDTIDWSILHCLKSAAFSHCQKSAELIRETAFSIWKSDSDELRIVWKSRWSLICHEPPLKQLWLWIQADSFFDFQ